MKNSLIYCFMQSKEGEHELYLYDAVRKYGRFNWREWKQEESETSAKKFRDALNEIPEGDTINLHINSEGGEVSEGVTIYNMLRQKSQAGCKIVGYVDGMAYSVAMDIAMACDEIHMGLGTSMFLHNPWAQAEGNAEQLRGIADQLDVLAEASVQLYTARAKNLTEDDIRGMMAKETMLDPEKCLEYGFCDIVDQYRAQEDPAQMRQELQIEQLKAQLENTMQQLKAQQEANTALLQLKTTPEPKEPEQEETDNKMMAAFLAAMRRETNV